MTIWKQPVRVYLISLEDRMATMGVEFRLTDDDRQKARFRIMSKLNARA